MDKYTGKRLDGRYEIQELIGIGGMATVYKAYDSVDDKTVAIKILKDEFLGNTEFMRRFKNEFKAVAVLSHPNIVQVYDVSFGDKMQYIVMEYIDGITLKEYITHKKVVPWKEAVHFTVQILQALQHAHGKGIVHRDMKPQNIMLLQDGTIKVMDFGIARFFNNETRTMTDKTIGSVHYIAPEQARGDATDGKADIYSVGIMLYEMLTGKVPFDGDTPVSVAIMQMQDEPQPLREINSEIPEGIEEITLKAMRKSPDQRYTDASEMLDAIEIFRRNPSVKFKYSYYSDEGTTKYVESVSTVQSAQSEPSYDDQYDSYDEEIAAHRSRKVFGWITGLIVMMIVAAIGVMIYMVADHQKKQTESKDVLVPDFVGQMYDQIQANKNYKFKYDITAKYDSTQPLNIVLSQDPEGGKKQIKEDGVIKLVINSTSTTYDVPKLKNYSESEAIERLENKYFNYVVARVNSTEVNKGYVINCSPQEGTAQEIGTYITLIVSDGPAIEKEEVPDVVGYKYDEAKKAIEANGFTTKKVTIASALEEGKVINTDPLAGNKLTRGSLITIQVSDGSKLVKSLTEVVPMPQNEYAEVDYAVYEDGKKLYSERIIPATIAEDGKTLEISPDGAKDNKKIITVYLGDDNPSKPENRYAVYTFDFKQKRVTRSFLNTNYVIRKGPEESSEEPSEEPSLTDIEQMRIDALNEIKMYRSGEGLDDEEIIARRDGITSAYETLFNMKDEEGAIIALIAEAKAEIDDLLDGTQQSSEDESSEPDESSDDSEESSEDNSDEPEVSPVSALILPGFDPYNLILF